MNLTNATIKGKNGLILKLALPASLGLFFNTLFNVVDTFFAGKYISTEALGGLTASAPFFFIIIALGSGIGTGANVLISNSLGEENKNSAKKYSENAITFAIIFSIIATALAYIFTPYGVKAITSEVYFKSTMGYLNIIYIGVIFQLLNGVFNSILMAQGDTKSYSNFLIIGFFINCILDPLFIVGIGGLPKLGVQGVALATVLVQAFGTIYLFSKVKKSKLLCSEKIKLRLDKEYILNILKQGIPASLGMLTMTFGMIVIMFYIKKLGTEATLAGYGPAMRIEQIVLIPVFGLNMALVPIAGQNYGAKNFERIKLAFKTALKYGLTFIMGASIISLFGARQLFQLFTNDQEVIREGLGYFYIDLWVFAAYVIMFMSISILQALKKPEFSLYIGVYRQLIAPIILFNLLGVFFGLKQYGIWWGVFISNWSAAIFTLIYTINYIRKLDNEFIEELKSEAEDSAVLN